MDQAKINYPSSPEECAKVAYQQGMCKVCAYCLHVSREDEIAHQFYCSSRVDYIFYRYQDGKYFARRHWQDQPEVSLNADLSGGLSSGSSLHDPSRSQPTEAIGKAKRTEVGIRYDLLDPEFLQAIARLAHKGAKIYGEGNWKKSRLSGDKGPVNHMFKHLGEYQRGESFDHLEVGENHKYQLVAIALNAMFEFWYCSHLEGEE